MRRIQQAILLVIALTVTAVFSPVFAQSEQQVETVAIQEIEFTEFPDVTVSFRALDAKNGVVSGLNGTNVSAQETGRQLDGIRVAEVQDFPLVLAVVIDNGRFANLNQFSTIRPNLEKLVTQGIFREGVDSVAIYKSGGPEGESEQVLDYTSVGIDYRNAVKALSLEGTVNTSQSVATIQRVIDDFATRNDAASAHFAILYIGRSFEGEVQSTLTAQSEALSDQLLSSGIRLHAIHTETDLGEQMTLLANNSGGEYIQYLRGQETGNLFDAIYSDIQAQALGYELSFRSQLPDIETREITVIVGDAEDSETYDVDLQPAKLAITSPLPEKIFRRIIERTEDGFTGDLNIIPVEAAQQDWPDGFEREIESAELLVDGVSVQKIDNPDTDTFRFTVDISDYNDTTTLPVVFRIRDELGIEANSPSINITIDAVEATPIPEVPVVEVVPEVEETEPEVESAAPQQPQPVPITPQQQPIVVTPCAQLAFTSECIQTYMPWLLSALLAIALIVLSWRYRTQVASVVPAPIRQVARDVRKTILGGGGLAGESPLARVYVEMARQDLVGQSIDIFAQTTTFGRDPKLCDIQLFQEDTRSSVSSQHCTLQFDPLQEIFLLTDDNSSAGTKVNDDRIPPNDPIRLNDGDIIVLGDLFRQGAKLRFEQIELPGFEDEFAAIDSDGDSRSTIVDDDDDDFNLFGSLEVDPEPQTQPQSEPAEQVAAKDIQIDDGKTVLDFGSDDDYEEFPAFDAEDSDDDWLSELE